jgi:hypothetical protein
LSNSESILRIGTDQNRKRIVQFILNLSEIMRLTSSST